MMRRWDDSQTYLSDNSSLVCEETANYLVIMCIDLEVEEVKTATKNVSFFILINVLWAVTKRYSLSLFFFFLLVETLIDGASGSSDHRHAVHSGVGKKPQGGPPRLLSTILCKD